MAEHLLLSFECDHQSLNPSVESKASLHGDPNRVYGVQCFYGRRYGKLLTNDIWLRFDNQGIGDESVQLHYSFISNVIGRHNKLKLPLTSISREELHSRVSLLVLFFFSKQNKHSDTNQNPTNPHFMCSAPNKKVHNQTNQSCLLPPL